MIEDPPKLVLRRSFPRPSADTLKPLENTPTGFIVDCLNGRGALPYDIKPLDSASSVAVGVALPCANGPDDNLGLLGAVHIARPGDFIIASTESFRHAAVTGDLVLGMARNRGVTGFATDGLIRDSSGCRAVGLPTFSRGVSPNSPVRSGPGSAGIAITLGTVIVNPGDIVVSDEDGVVVIPADKLDVVVSRLIDVRELEAGMDKAVMIDGLDDPPFIKEIIERGEVQEID